MRRIRLFFAACLAMASGAAFAQNVVYTQGNAKIVQLTDGWQILCGESVVAHGDGTLDINNLPPAFRDFLDIYAQQEEPVADAAKSDDEPVYGPLISTQWNQDKPYNNLFPIVDGEYHAVTGCAVTATAQILNYYQYCLPLNLSGTYYTSSSSIESPYISNVTAKGGVLYYDYNFSYTPDFEKINADNEQLAKLFLAIAFAQKAIFALSATPATNTDISIWELYGYGMLPFTDDGRNGTGYFPRIEDLTTNDYIASAIKKGIPVNITGSNENRDSHAFIIDGCHGNEFHINYGWGGYGDGWFTTTLFPLNMSILAAHPADAAFMQAAPKYLNIKGENGFSKRIEMEQSEGNKLEYKQKGNLNLDAGVYEFCFEYADGSTIAPYTDSVIKLKEEYTKQGRFVSAPAKIEISNNYNVDFWIKQNKAEIDVVCVDYRVAVTGRITDSHSKPLQGVRVATVATDPAPAIVSRNDNSTIEWSKMVNGFSTSNAYFTATKQYISQVEFKVSKHNSPNGLKFRVFLDNDSRVLYQKTLPDDVIINNGWTSVEFDSCLSVVPGKRYRLNISADASSEDAYYSIALDRYSWYSEWLYRVWSCDNFFVTTDADGRYSIEIEKYSTTNLTAYHSDYDFNSHRLQNLDRELSGVDFKGADVKVTIAGRVTDKDSNPLEGVCVTTAATGPVLSDELKCESEGDVSYWRQISVVSQWYTNSFVATQPYITQVDFKVWKNGSPNGLTVAILDSAKNVLWQKALPDSVVLDGGRWTQVAVDEMLKVEQGREYYIGLSVADNTGGGSYVIFLDENGDMLYHVKLCAAWFVNSDENGNYSFQVDRFFTGTLHAHSDGRKFNALSFTNLPDNVVGNFVEGGTDSKIDYQPDSIMILPPFKTNYYVGDAFDTTGMIVYSCYSNGIRRIVTDYEVSKVDLSAEGGKRVTVTYSGKTAGFNLSVELPRYSITYKVDGEVYAFVDSVVCGTPITAIAAPTKEGYTFSGWSQMPETMPYKDIVVTGSFTINKHSITYMVDNKQLYVVTDVAIGTTLVPIPAPAKKKHYTFSGWSGLPETMPDEDIVVTGTFTINKHSIIYMVDNEQYSVVENVAFDTEIVPIDAPIKEGYMFTGWSLKGTQDYVPQTMPDEDIIIVGSFIKTEETTAVELYEAESVRVWASGRAIVVENANAEVFVYDVIGNLICKDAMKRDRATITVKNPGGYIVKVGGKAWRVFVE